MAIIKAKPTSAGRRFVVSVKSDLYKGKPISHCLIKNQKMVAEIIMEGLPFVIRAVDINNIIEL